MVLADNRMDVKVDQLVTHEEQGQQTGYRQSKWLEKFKRPKPAKSHYGKPKAHFRAPRPYHGAPVTTHYTPQQTSYYQNPTPYKTAYPPQPTYVPTLSAGGPPKVNYYQNVSPYNGPQVAYRTPANSPSHPSFSKPEGENSPPAPAYQELVNSNPVQPHLNYIPSQPVIPQSPVYTPPVNTHPLHPPFSQPGNVDGSVHSEPADYRNPENSQPPQPTPDYVPSNPENPLPAVYLPPVTNNQKESYSHAEPAIIKPLEDFKEIINNNSPQLSHGHLEQVNNPSVQDHRAPVSEEPSQHSVDNIAFEPVNPLIYEPPVDNNPGQFPFSHSESVNNSPLPNYEELSHNNPLESSFSQLEPVNDNPLEQSFDHQEPINNTPPGYGEPTNDSPLEPSYSQQESTNSQLPSNFNEQVNINLPQVFHGQMETIDSNPVQPSFGHPDVMDNQPSFHSNPSQSFYSEQELVDSVPLSHFEGPLNNDAPNPSFDYIPSEISYSNKEPVYKQPFHVEESPQPAHIEVPQSTPKTQGHNIPTQDSFLSTEAPSFHSSTTSPVASTESETLLDFPHSPFSTNVEGDTPPLFFDEFTKSERENQDPDTGFFEFGIFPKSNSFFLQNYRG